jgi:two-component system NtrC family sensor kinase
MLAMIALGLVALRRTRREASAYTQLRHEVTRREQTELALHQAMKMEAVGRLTGGIAHDFNNLLTAILGNVDLALRRTGDGDERLKRSLSSARQASERAASLVQRLLAFSRQHPQEVKAVDVNRLVQDMSELLRRTIGETITVETVLAGGLWKTAIDPNQLENAILNLAINARDAMKEGGRLTIETANTYLDEAYVAANGPDLTAGQYVMLAISDTGSGMGPEVIERAFEPFFTTKPTGAGTGLGLSMVYGFVKQSGGHVKIYSETGEGTSIKLYLPRLADESRVEPWIPVNHAKENADIASKRPEKILLVEDDEEVNRFSSEILRDEGYQVISTHEGASGLRLLDANPDIRLLFTDVVLPGGMNGRELADEARRRRPDLKVLFTTGYTRNAIIHQGRLDADVDLLTKPFTSEALARKVRQILDMEANDPVTRVNAILDSLKNRPQNES